MRRKTRAKPELSVFDEELNVKFNPTDFEPDRPNHVPKNIQKEERKADEADIQPTTRKAKFKGETTAATHITSISPAIHQQIASSKDTISPANNQHIASNNNLLNDIASISPAISPAPTPAYHQQITSISPANWTASALSGKEAFLLRLIFNACKNTGSLTTDFMSSQSLANLLEVSTKRLNNVVERLVEKALLQVLSFKRGRGAWRQFQLPNAVYQEITLNSIASISPANNQHIASISPSISPAISPAAPSSSSSIDLNKLTTTSELPPEWGRVDFSALASIGFRETHVKQLATAGLLNPGTLQESINAFAFDLEVNGKAGDINGPPLNYLMGILRKGPYVPAENYESPEVRQMRQYLEAQKRVVEREERQLLELKEVEFKKWELSLSSQVIDELTPLGKSEAARRSQLLNHFSDHIWPRKLTEIQNSLRNGATQAHELEPSAAT